MYSELYHKLHSLRIIRNTQREYLHQNCVDPIRHTSSAFSNGIFQYYITIMTIFSGKQGTNIMTISNVMKELKAFFNKHKQSEKPINTWSLLEKKLRAPTMLP